MASREEESRRMERRRERESKRMERPGGQREGWSTRLGSSSNVTEILRVMRSFLFPLWRGKALPPITAAGEARKATLASVP